MDLFLNEGKSNDYLRDFLTLTEDEIKAAFLYSISEKRLIPQGEAELSNEEGSFIACIVRTQKLIARIDRTEPKDIESCIDELGNKMDIIYAAIPER